MALAAGMNNYIDNIRSMIGHKKLIHPAARIIIENHNDQVLVIERADNGRLGLPAGSLEENETIAQCIIREVKEETGISINTLEVIGISTNPKTETVDYPNGDLIQYFTVEFYSNHWEGDIIVGDPEEVKSARFVGKDQISKLPENERSAFESLEYFLRENRVMLK